MRKATTAKTTAACTATATAEAASWFIAVELTIYDVRDEDFGFRIIRGFQSDHQRFLFTSLNTQSQFIIAKHSKRTMAITNRIYGVTIQEAGVSKLVSVKFDEAVSAA